jgi:DNA-directed RNA polymerase subunit M/transcription elongation factor TFIIS
MNKCGTMIKEKDKTRPEYQRFLKYFTPVMGIRADLSNIISKDNFFFLDFEADSFDRAKNFLSILKSYQFAVTISYMTGERLYFRGAGANRLRTTIENWRCPKCGNLGCEQTIVSDKSEGPNKEIFFDCFNCGHIVCNSVKDFA